jgi:hypothetical protein
MNREELVAVRDVIDALLRCPDHVRELLTQWIAPVVARDPWRALRLIAKPSLTFSANSGVWRRTVRAWLTSFAAYLFRLDA